MLQKWIIYKGKPQIYIDVHLHQLKKTHKNYNIVTAIQDSHIYLTWLFYSLIFIGWCSDVVLNHIEWGNYENNLWCYQELNKP